jgi:predicted ArsR family transcriptional regulator
MASELHTLDDLSRHILHTLFEGWYTTDDVKSAGTLHASEIAAAVGRPEPEVRDHLLLLETLGYVLTQRISAGGDPTLEYKHVDETSGGGDDHEMVYSIADPGKQFVAADALAGALAGASHDQGAAQATST